MRRKLIKQAGQALTITLPIEWIRENNLKQGDEIELEITEKDLVLSSGKKIKGDSVKLNTIDFSEKMKYIYMNSIYAKGIDEIYLESDKKNYPDLNQNLGFAAVSQKGNSYIVRDVSGITNENLDDILKRVFQMILSFYDSAIEGIFSRNSEDYEKIRKKDIEINKFALFLQRSIMKKSYPDPVMGKVLFAYSFALEKISDEILRLWRTSLQKKIKKESRVKEIILLSRKSLEKAFEIYYRTSPELIKEMIALREEIRKKSIPLLKMDAETAEFIMHALKITEDCYDLTHLTLMKKTE